MASSNTSSRRKSGAKKKEKKSKHRRESGGADKRDGSKRDRKKKQKRRRENDGEGERPAPTAVAVVEEEAPDKAEHVEAPTWNHLNAASRPDPPGKVRVVVRPSVKSHDPIAVSFPGGVPDSMLRAEEEARKKVRFPHKDGDSDVPTFAWSRTHPAKKRSMAVRGADSTCSYAASCEGGRDRDGRLTQLSVALYDTKSQTLTVQPVAGRGNVFALSQSVRSYDPSSGAAIGSAASADMTLAERKRLLFESFGSSKKQRALKSQAANVVNIDAVAGGGSAVMGALERQVKGGNVSKSNVEAMERAAMKVRGIKGDEGSRAVTMGGTMNHTVDAALAEARAAVLPPYDEDASEPHLVYDPTDIAGDDAWSQICRVVDVCAHMGPNEWRKSLTTKEGKDENWVVAGWIPSVAALLETIEDPKSDSADTERVRVVLLLRHLVAFHLKFEERERGRRTDVAFGGEPDELANVFDLPRPMCNRLLTTMASFIPSMGGTDAGYAATKTHRDKRLVHMLLLYLMAHGRAMKAPSVGQFCRDLKLDLAEAAHLLREAGCTVKKGKGGIAGGAVSAALMVPLTFPPPKRGRK